VGFGARTGDRSRACLEHRYAVKNRGRCKSDELRRVWLLLSATASGGLTARSLGGLRDQRDDATVR